MFKRFLAALLAFVAMSVFAAVDVNSASQSELDGVKGIGPVIAGRIVEARKTGPFKDWGDFIERVKGVGEHNAAKFSDGGLTVNGTTYKGVPAKATPAATQSKSTAATTATPAAAPAPVAKADAKTDAKAAKEAAKKEKAEKAEAAKKEKAEKAEARKKEKETKAAAKTASAAKN